MRDIVIQRLLNNSQYMESLSGLTTDEAKMDVLRNISDVRLLEIYEDLVKKLHYEPCESYYIDTGKVMR